MQKVTQAWKNAQRKNLVPESFVEINFDIGNPEAQSSGTVEADVMYFSTPQEILEEISNPIKYGLLEPGKWILDGTYRIVGGSIEPPPETHSGFIPFGDEDTFVTAEGEEFFVLNA